MTKRCIFRTIIIGTAGITMLFSNGTASGAGYAIQEQSVKGLGTAFAGGAAAAEDASTIFHNPAGLTRLRRSETLVGTYLIAPSGRFHNNGSTDLTGQPLQGDEGGDPGRRSLIPTVYFTVPVSDRLSVGLGLFSPFGLSTAYPRTWVGRYHAMESKLTTLTLNPSLAYRITGRLSLGAGVDIQYAKARLTNAIDFGTIFSALGAPGAAPQRNDGFVTLEGDSWSLGYNCGALLEIDDTRIGIAYRSSVNHTLRGEAAYSGVPASNPTGRFKDGGIRAGVTLPDSLSLSLLQNLSPHVAAMADITWTNWSTFNELRIRFDNLAENDVVTTTAWKDTFRYSLGGVYHPEPWTFRLGVAYDQTPVPDAGHRTPRIPDNDRTWLATGVGYAFGPSTRIDVGYAHIFVRNASIDKSASGEDRFRGALKGSYESSGDVVGAEATWEF